MLAAKSGGLPGSGRFYPGDTCATYRHPTFIVPRIEDRRRRRSSVLLFVSFFREVIKFKRFVIVDLLRFVDRLNTREEF